MAKKLKTNERNEFASTKLKALLENYKKYDETQRVREESKVLIRQFGDDALLEQFRNNTKARFGTPDVEMDKLRTAIKVAITHFENMAMFDSTTDVRVSGAWPKVFSYIPWFLVIFFVFVAVSNWHLAAQIKLNSMQWSLFAIIVAIGTSGAFIKKSDLGERIFQVFLVILGAVLARILTDL